ncbi:type II toxin-antitoxin system RelE/ParE family toxin [Parabacteroides distasonis]|uniref:type II toxin-antitoxin system RelE/ParE family toxin n=1 Tax=Parabacteroides distasonis TaxID=823 RepID=UPI003F748DFA
MEKQTKIIWAPRARRQADLAIAYCLEHFGKEAALKFISKLEKDCVRIKNNPLIGNVENAFANRDKEHRSLIEGHHKLVYTIEKNNTIHIVLLWDCRQHPDKLRTSIR